VSGSDWDERRAQPALSERRDTDDPPSEDSDPQLRPEPERSAPDDGGWPSREGAASSQEATVLAQPELDAPSEEAVSENGAATPPAVEAEPASDEGQAEAAEDDPFANWPEPDSGAVIEDDPVEGAGVQHVEGEIDVPDGYTVLEGSPLGRRRSVAVVVSRFNGGLTNRMLAEALDALEQAEVSSDAVTVVPVPGAFELPLAAMALAKTRRFACVVALGAIVRGETPHFDYVASEAASGLQLAAIETGVPVAFGVLTVETAEQGEARIDRARDAVQAALEMADLFARLRASAH
jgi:6,7-dimethyl-8-ribityllumazine synthase